VLVLTILGFEEFRKILSEYRNELLLVEEHDTADVQDVLEAWEELQKESFVICSSWNRKLSGKALSTPICSDPVPATSARGAI
jgi:predicted metal-binding protein